jgi:6-pyruvoyltetrahydropterin/6-carboxytetrahydropterin synthase
MKISKTFAFDMAHMLDSHDGKCRNLHGHTYQLTVTIQGDIIQSGPKAGMVMDFADLKQAIKEHILNPLDHAFAYNCNSNQENELASMLMSWQRKTFALSTPTTAENLTQWIFQTLKQQGLPICRLQLWETPSSCCEYEEEIS